MDVRALLAATMIPAAMSEASGLKARPLMVEVRRVAQLELI
jgi:hypothetical protein